MSRNLDASIHFFFLISAIFCWVFTKSPKQGIYLFAGLYLIFTFIFDGLAALIMLGYWKLKSNTNLFLYHILTPIQFAICMLIFQNILISNFWKRIALFLIPVFILMSLIFSFSIQTFDLYNSYSILAKYAILIFFALIFFYEVLVNAPYLKIYNETAFWLSTGFFFHSSFNLLFEGFSNYLQTYGSAKYNIIFLLSSVSNYLLFVSLTVAILTSAFKSKKV